MQLLLPHKVFYSTIGSKPYTGNTKTLRASIFLSIGQMGRIPQLGKLSASNSVGCKKARTFPPPNRSGRAGENGSPANLEPKWHKGKAKVKSHPHHPLCTLCNCYCHTKCSTQQLALNRTQATRRLSERASFYQLARWVASHS